MIRVEEITNGLVAISNYKRFVLKHIDETTLKLTDIPVLDAKDIIIQGSELSSDIYVTEYQNMVLCYYKEAYWVIKVFAKLICKTRYHAILMDFEGKNWKIEHYQDDPYLKEAFVHIVPVQ